MISVTGIKIEPTLFPDGTSQVWHLPEDVMLYFEQCRDMRTHAVIKWDFQSEGELMQVCQLSHLARVSFVGLKRMLHVPYLPYGRQDKEVSNDHTFAVKTFALLVSQFFNGLSTIDAHSNVLDRLSKCYPDKYPVFINIFPKKEIERAVARSNAEYICYPDSSAKERYSKHINRPCIFMDKIRDQETGGITSLRMNTSGGCNHYLKNKNILIVDDICDGGRTFIECAKILHLHEVNSIALYVTHGIFSKGLAPLEDAGITEIYTKDGLRSCPF